MPESKTKRSVAMSQQNEVMYPTEKLLKSKQLAGYQPDFARVILTEPEYTISGAIDALERALKGGR